MRVHEQYDIRKCPTCGKYFEIFDPHDQEELCDDCIADTLLSMRDLNAFENEKREL